MIFQGSRAYTVTMSQQGESSKDWSRLVPTPSMRIDHSSMIEWLSLITLFSPLISICIIMYIIYSLGDWVQVRDCSTFLTICEISVRIWSYIALGKYQPLGLKQGSSQYLITLNKLYPALSKPCMFYSYTTPGPANKLTVAVNVQTSWQCMTCFMCFP